MILSEDLVVRGDAVDSVQRYPGPPPDEDLGRLYFGWLDRAWWPLVRVRVLPDGGVRAALLGLILLRLARPAADRPDYEVVGGLLARPGGTFCFSASGGEVVAALRGFRPRLPMWLYRLTHGPVHVLTMARFGRHLRTRSEAR